MDVYDVFDGGWMRCLLFLTRMMLGMNFGLSALFAQSGKDDPFEIFLASMRRLCRVSNLSKSVMMIISIEIAVVVLYWMRGIFWWH